MKVCIIGAGLSGLVAAKELTEEDQHIICYEKSDQVGGVFSSHSENSPNYDDYLLTISNYFMAFSSLPPEEPERVFWTGGEYQQYLQRFVRHFDLLRHIRFNTEVIEVRRHNEGWQVRTRSGVLESTEYFDAVVACPGRFNVPFMPELPGIGGFKGEIIHALDYRNADRLKDKKVVIMGIGESSADICHQISQVAESATLVLRRPPYVLPRNLKNLMGVDAVNDAGTCRFVYRIAPLNAHPRPAVRRFFSSLIRNVPVPSQDPATNLINKWNLLSGGVCGQPFTKNDIFAQDIVDGRLDFNLFGVKKLDGRHVVTGDGKRIEADALMVCTGYRADFSMFSTEADIQSVAENDRRLYKHMFHPAYGKSLAFLGFARPEPGGVPTCSELQARYFARVCSGRAQLPDTREMENLIQRDQQDEEAYYFIKPGVTELIRYHIYTAELAALIGCKPGWREKLHPGMFYRYHFGSSVSNWFRLRGPGSDRTEARRVIRHLRVVYPLPLVFAFSVVKLSVELVAMADRLSFGLLSRWAAKRRPSLDWVIRRELKRQVNNDEVTLESLCESAMQLQHLKYAVCKNFMLDPLDVRDDITITAIRAMIDERRDFPANSSSIMPTG